MPFNLRSSNRNSKMAVIEVSEVWLDFGGRTNTTFRTSPFPSPCPPHTHHTHTHMHTYLHTTHNTYRHEYGIPHVASHIHGPFPLCLSCTWAATGEVVKGHDVVLLRHSHNPSRGRFGQVRHSAKRHTQLLLPFTSCMTSFLLPPSAASARHFFFSPSISSSHPAPPAWFAFIDRFPPNSTLQRLPQLLSFPSTRFLSASTFLDTPLLSLYLPIRFHSLLSQQTFHHDFTKPSLHTASRPY